MADDANLSQRKRKLVEEALRHTFCTELARDGVPVNVIKELAGHKSLETTLRYMHTDRASKRGAIDALRGLQSASNATAT